MGMNRLLVLLAVTLTSCGMAAGVDGSDAGGVEGPAEVPEEIEPVDVLKVACSEEGLDVASPRVRTHPDGVRLEITELFGEGTSVELAGQTDAEPGMGVAGLGGAHEVGERVVDAVRPGRALVRCYPEDGPRHFMSAEEDPEVVVIDIVDEGGYWREPGTLECLSDLVATTNPLYGVNGADATAGLELEEVAAQSIPQPWDHLDVVGYAQGEARWVRALRDGRVVALASYSQQHSGNWRAGSISACADD